MTSRSRSAADADVDPEAHVPQQSHSVFDAIERTFRPTVFRSSAGAAHSSDEEVERAIDKSSRRVTTSHHVSNKRRPVPPPPQLHHNTVRRRRAGAGEPVHGHEATPNKSPKDREEALANLRTAETAAEETERKLRAELVRLKEEQPRPGLSPAIRETEKGLEELEIDEKKAKREIGEAGGDGGGARGDAPGGAEVRPRRGPQAGHGHGHGHLGGHPEPTGVGHLRMTEPAGGRGRGNEREEKEEKEKERRKPRKGSRHR